jgi:signal transduction histidine kinase
MVVQAAAAERLLAGDPPRSGRALASVQQTGRDAITELRRMLRILRTDEPRGRPPAFESARHRQRPRRRLPVSWSPRVDLLIAVGCFAIAELWVLTGPGYGRADRLVGALLVPAATLPLAVRRRFPLATLLTIVGAVATQQLVTEWEPPVRAAPSPGQETPAALSIAGLVAIYSVAENASLRRALFGAAVTVVVAVAADAVLMDRFGGLQMVFIWSCFVAFAFLPGRVVRLHRRQTEQLRTLAARLERERQARARLAVVEERTRLARELHDAIAHGVSVMVLQAGAAERVLAAAPGQAREAACAVQDTGRTVLDELRRLLGVLGTDEQDSPDMPRARLAELDALLAHVRDAGLPVELRVNGNPAELPAGMDVSAYRVIQEGLTNALKHAGTVPTTVSLCYDPDALTVEVTNGGGDAHTPAAPEPGHGLVGMRERVALYDGQLEAGPRPAGGFSVRARLPLTGGAT